MVTVKPHVLPKVRTPKHSTRNAVLTEKKLERKSTNATNATGCTDKTMLLEIAENNKDAQLVNAKLAHSGSLSSSHPTAGFSKKPHGKITLNMRV